MKLFCKHQYKYFNITEKFDGYFYYVFEFCCTKCGKVKRISEYEIQDVLNNAKSKYNKYIAMGSAKDLDDASLILPNSYYDSNLVYKGKYVSIVLEEYRKKGIDLKEIYSIWRDNEQNKN